jgi:hypothetical protein
VLTHNVSMSNCRVFRASSIFKNPSFGVKYPIGFYHSITVQGKRIDGFSTAPASIPA